LEEPRHLSADRLWFKDGTSELMLLTVENGRREASLEKFISLKNHIGLQQSFDLFEIRSWAQDNARTCFRRARQGNLKRNEPKLPNKSRRIKQNENKKN